MCRHLYITFSPMTFGKLAFYGILYKRCYRETCWGLKWAKHVFLPFSVSFPAIASHTPTLLSFRILLCPLPLPFLLPLPISYYTFHCSLTALHASKQKSCFTFTLGCRKCVGPLLCRCCWCSQHINPSHTLPSFPKVTLAGNNMGFLA